MDNFIKHYLRPSRLIFAVVFLCLVNYSNASCQRTEVLILGAGASGIAAADALHQKGVDFLVLEGRERIGGRVHHVMYKGSKLELGAAWSHDSQHNHSVWKLLKRFGMAVQRDAVNVTYRFVKVFLTRHI